MRHRDNLAVTPARWPVPQLVLGFGERLVLRTSGHKSGHCDSYTSAFCDHHADGLGIRCRRCGSWCRGETPPTCPLYVTRSEPDNARLPQIKTHAENTAAHRQFLANLDPAWGDT